MIVDGILLVFQGVLNILLAPLTILNIGVDLIASIPYVTQFLQVVVYILPWSNLLPLIVVIISICMFRISLSFVKLILNFIPFF